MADQLTTETLELLYQHTREVPAAQQKTRESLDNKMIQVFGAAGVVIGLAGIASGNLKGGIATDAALVGAVIAYAVTAVFAVAQLWPQYFRRNLQADVLWQQYWLRTPV